MSVITFDRFDAGLDLRKGASVSDANRLRRLDNCYVTTGRTIKKRPGLTLVTTLEPGTVGLRAAGGKLNTFYGVGTVSHADTRFLPNKVAHPTPAGAVFVTLAFNNGSSEPMLGTLISGNSSGAKGVLLSVALNSGSWAASSAAGSLFVGGVSGTFVNGESLSFTDRGFGEGFDLGFG